MKIQITFFLFILLAISSCTVEKRLYTKGFHVEFHKRHHGADSRNMLQSVSDQAENHPDDIHPDSIIIIPITKKLSVNEISSKADDNQPVLETPFVSKPPEKRFSPFHKRTRVHRVSLKKSRFLTNPVSELKEKQFKNPKNDRNYRQFWEIMGFIGLLAGLLGIILLFIFIENPVCLLILQIVLAGLALAGLIWLIAALCGLHFEWFWSGR